MSTSIYLLSLCLPLGTLLLIFGMRYFSAVQQAKAGKFKGGTDVLFNAVLHSGRYVSGSWGSGRLLHTSLLSILITSNGRVLVGAVTPSVLYADAARAS